MTERWLRIANLMMPPPEGEASADGGGGGGGSSPGGDAGGGAAAAEAAAPGSSSSPSTTTEAAPSPAGDGTAPAGAPAEAATAAPSPAGVDAASTTNDITPSLLSSADPKGSQEPAPGTEAATDKAADPPKDGEPAKTETKAEGPDKEPAKDADAAGGDAKDATDPAKTEATADQAVALSIADLVFGEGITPEAEQAKAFLDVLNDRELGAKDRGQRLLDLHTAEVGRVYKEVNDHQQTFWQNLNRGWRDQLRNDPEIGGNQFNTHLSYARGMIEMFLPAEEAEALLKHADANGMGNYPPFIRLLSRAGRKLEVFEDGMVGANPAPQKPRREAGNRGWYDNSLEKPAT